MTHGQEDLESASQRSNAWPMLPHRAASAGHSMLESHASRLAPSAIGAHAKHGMVLVIRPYIHCAFGWVLGSTPDCHTRSGLILSRPLHGILRIQNEPYLVTPMVCKQLISIWQEKLLLDAA